METEHTGGIYVGVGGWSYEPWRGTFYPEKLPHKRELEYASRHLTSIEINSTFYRSQRPEVFRKWHDETPPSFVFAVKGPRYPTSRRVLAEAGASIERFFGSGVLELRDKLGPVNWQFLPSRAFDPVDFEAFLDLLPRCIDGRVIRHVIEVRHPSFHCPELVAMARERAIAIVVAADSPYPQIADVTAPFIYVRVMGTQETEPLGYPRPTLDLWARRARAWASGAVPEPPLSSVTAQHTCGTPREVFLYFIGGHKRLNPAAASALIDKLRNA